MGVSDIDPCILIDWNWLVLTGPTEACEILFLSTKNNIVNIMYQKAASENNCNRTDATPLYERLTNLIILLRQRLIFRLFHPCYLPPRSGSSLPSCMKLPSCVWLSRTNYLCLPICSRTALPAKGLAYQ